MFEVDAFETRAVALIADVAKQEGADVLDGKHPVLLVSGTSSRFSRGAREKVARRSERRVGGISLPERGTDGTVDNGVHEKSVGEGVRTRRRDWRRDSGGYRKMCGRHVDKRWRRRETCTTFSKSSGKRCRSKRDRDRSWPYRRRLDPGAELTKNSVLEAGDRKVSMRHPLMLPDLVIVDPKLTAQMPKDVTAHTGLDALTQCIEPYVCNAPNPVTDSLSMSGIKLGAKEFTEMFGTAGRYRRENRYGVVRHVWRYGVGKRQIRRGAWI